MMESNYEAPSLFGIVLINEGNEVEVVSVNTKKRPTLREIAKQAEVSPATVSLVLNGKAGVNDITRRRVLECAKNSKYASASFHTFEENETKRFAVILPYPISEISESFQTELSKSIIDACRTYGCDAVYTSIKDIDGRIELPDAIALKDVNGIIFVGDINDYLYGFLSSAGLPVVILDSHCLRDDRLCVYVDYQQAAFTATHYLIGLGHKDIAYIGNEQQHLFNMSVFAGFQAALQQENMTLNVNRIQMNVFDYATFYAAMDTLFDSGTCMPTALFCASDLPAILALNYLATHTIRVPEEVSLAGIDDLTMSQLVIPSLTTVKVDRKELGRLGVKLLLDKTVGKETASITLPSNKLIVRNSTAKPRSITTAF